MHNKSVIHSMREIMKRNKVFNNHLEKLRLPTIFSIMALLSNDKVNLFNDELINFVEYLIVTDHNKNEEMANLSAFIIDKMIINEQLDYKRDPEISFVNIF